MPIENDPTIHFLASAHDTFSKADELLEILKEAYTVIEATPELPPEHAEFHVALINTILELKVLAKGLLEHHTEINDEIDKVIASIDTALDK